MITFFCQDEILIPTYQEILKDFPFFITNQKEDFNKKAAKDLIILDCDLNMLSKLDIPEQASVIYLGQQPTPQENIFFIEKPFVLSVLWERVNLLWSRIQKGMLINFSTPKYTFNGLSKQLNNIQLTQKEAEIIECLYEHKNEIVKKEDLLTSVFGYCGETETHTLETHIYKLRQKIGSKEDLIQTKDGGYKINLD